MVEQGVGLPPGQGHPFHVEALADQQQVAPGRAGVVGRGQHLPGDLGHLEGRQRRVLGIEQPHRPGGVQGPPGLGREQQREPRAGRDQHHPGHWDPSGRVMGG